MLFRSGSVEANPIRITSKPCEVTPEEKASAKSGDDGRISSPITTVPGSRCNSRNFAKATPVEKANCLVNSLPTRPRMSYALKIFGNLSVIRNSVTGLKNLCARVWYGT